LIKDPTKSLFSVVAVESNGARRSRRFRVAQTRNRRGNPEAQEFAAGEAAFKAAPLPADLVGR